ncbi:MULTISPECIES: hypothetical protein [unclassified Microbacterium]|uniref:hypothetical protein n=1 Tax=unclassified Microbacterium TaxID=2609290 RepID=UPI000DE3C4AF|nr:MULTISPECIES: hypothetical protein [unclassified Microbacterium]NYF30308.1 hypothetical protein [Microbacterium sp. JAI119]RBO72166.1 hypothetical protein DSP71_12400 [Microbacterium sp. H6]
MIRVSHATRTSPYEPTRLFISIATSAALALGAIALPTTSSWADTGGDGDQTTAGHEIAAALEHVEGSLVGDFAPSEIEDGLDDESAQVGVRVEVSNDATEGVQISTGNFVLGIDLPHADAADTGEGLPNGGVAYPSTMDSANAVIPVDGGAQLLTVISNDAAPERFDYGLTMPPENRLEETADGGAQIVDSTGKAVVIFEPAWARDSSGRSVPTHYSVQGNVLTQTVAHKSLSSISYPIVADPLPVVVIVITAAAAIVVAAAALGVATWIVISWWNTCRAQGKYPELSTRNGFTARCVR